MLMAPIQPDAASVWDEANGMRKYWNTIATTVDYCSAHYAQPTNLR